MAKPFRIKRPEGTLSEINVVPLVDVVFNLLIIFMILAPVIHKGVDVSVPESAVGESSVEPEQHVVTITKEGAIWFDDQEATLDALRQQVGSLEHVETVYVQSDKDISYGMVMDVISALKESGIRNVGLVTKPRVASTAAK